MSFTDELEPGALPFGGQIVVGALCSMAKTKSGQGFSTAPAHLDVGGQLPHTLAAGESIHYRLVIQPDDTVQGLPSAAQKTSTSLNLVFSGFDY